MKFEKMVTGWERRFAINFGCVVYKRFLGHHVLNATCLRSWDCYGTYYVQIIKREEQSSHRVQKIVSLNRIVHNNT